MIPGKLKVWTLNMVMETLTTENKLPQCAGQRVARQLTAQVLRVVRRGAPGAKGRQTPTIPVSFFISIHLV